MHTEDEARKTRCCGGCAAHPQHDGMCKASACMAWRLDKDAWLTSGEKVIQTDREPECGYGPWVKQGYCGLAGKDGA